MISRILALVVLVGAIASLTIPPATTRADGPNEAVPISYELASPLPQPSVAGPEVGAAALMLELADPPAILAGDAAVVQEQRVRIELAQTDLEEPLAALGARVLFRTRLAYNGIAVTVPAEQIPALAALPGVVAVHPISGKRPAEAGVAPYIGAAHLWSYGKATGMGVRIGIIDTGVDYTHATFGGPGTPAAYANPGRVFPTGKVAGVDLAGDGYDASGVYGSPVATPDRDPLDCNGHGTHIAGIAAGFGVTGEGNAYHGLYSSSVDYSSFRVPPGVAPEAQIYAIKIFGCRGTTALVTQAIEHALDPNGDGNPSDRLDVINLSLGTPFGSADDPDAVAVESAVRAGTVVVAAVGDNGSTFYGTNAPASAPGAIAVGATEAVTGLPVFDAPTGFSSRGPQRGNGAVKPDVVAPGAGVVSAAAGSGSGVAARDGTSAATAQVAGAAALLRQLHGGWTPTQVKAALMNAAAPVRLPDGSLAPPSLAGAGQLSLVGLEQVTLLAYAADGISPGGLSFGAPSSAEAWTGTRTLTIQNRTDTRRDVVLTAVTAASEPGVRIELPETPVTIAPRATVTIPVRASFSPASLDFSADAATPTKQDGFARYYMAEHAGFVQITEAVTRLRAAHAADESPVRFVVDGKQLGAGLRSGEVGSYEQATAGRHTVRVELQSAPAGAAPLLTSEVTLPQHGDYSIVLAGRGPSFGLIVVPDSPTVTPRRDHAYIRYVNAHVPGAGDFGPLDVYLADRTLQARALAVGAVSGYVELVPGSYTVLFVRAGEVPSADSLVAWKALTIKAGELVFVGAGHFDRYAAEGGTTCGALNLAGGAPPDGPVAASTREEKICDAERRALVAQSPGRAAGGVPLRVPFQVFPKSASAARAPETVVAPDGARGVQFTLANTGARRAPLSSIPASPQVALVSAFALAAESGLQPGLSQGLRAADLRYVGLTSSYVHAPAVTTPYVFFGIAAHGPWSTPNEVEFRIYIDSDRNGKPDHMLLNTNYGTFAGKPSDVFIAPVYRVDESTGKAEAFAFSFWNTLQAPTVSPGLDVAPFNTSVMFMGARADQLGLGPGSTRFNYYVETRARDWQNFREVVDRVPSLGQPDLNYDIARPATAPLNLTSPILAQRPLFAAGDGEQVTTLVDPELLDARGFERLLLLHHHNLPGAQAQLVEIQSREYAGRQPEGKELTKHTFLPLVPNGRRP